MHKVEEVWPVHKAWHLVLPKRNTHDYVELSDCDTKGGRGCGLEEHYRATISHREPCYVKVFLIMQAVWATGPDSHCEGSEQPIKKTLNVLPLANTFHHTPRVFFFWGEGGISCSRLSYFRASLTHSPSWHDLGGCRSILRVHTGPNRMH